MRSLNAALGVERHGVWMLRRKGVARMVKCGEQLG